MITDDSLDNLQVRGFPFIRGMVGCSEAPTHPTHNPCYARLFFLRAWTVIGALYYDVH